MNSDQEVRVVHRRDYAPPPYWIDRVELEFDLDASDTTVTARLDLRRNEQQPVGPLVLDGEDLELKAIHLDGQELAAARYQVQPDRLVIHDLPARCRLETRVGIHPAANTELSGLYQSAGNFCTQCEALGFRRITYFLDRPDVMARYRVVLRADPAECPVLLSNGNRIARRTLPDGRQEVTWDDPFPKPSYLFALVAGDLKCHSGSFVTASGRQVRLEIWVEPQNIDRCAHALSSLQKAMRWDEQTYGLEYDLDVYMIVAVNDFNMGAMENKGLNIFNSKYVLASPASATDDDYLRIEAVIAHEYFHNWTGNRITCRDWFQLTLKEGLTVFRDQQFTSDQTSAAVKRIDDVSTLRSRQFLEDSGPMAHPIRPESYIAMDNFYTATVYEKGAEVVRLYHTLLGAEGFRRGMDLYFQRHDGCAVTCDDFRQAMADANNTQLDQLDRWYSQAGTPELAVSGRWIPQSGHYVLTCRQGYPPLPDGIPGATNRLPVPIPIGVGLLDQAGQPLPLQLSDEPSPSGTETRLLLLDQAECEFTFVGLDQPPVPSVLRDFSAPVRLKMNRSPEELALLMSYDSDPFNRWDAGQALATQLLVEMVGQPQPGGEIECPRSFSDAFGYVLADEELDGSFKALALTLPSETVLGQEFARLDPEAVHQAREALRSGLARRHRAALLSTYHTLSTEVPYRNDQQSVDKRRLKNTVLAYLSCLNEPEMTDLVARQYKHADNMTDRQAALALLADLDCPQRADALAHFYEAWRTDPLVLDKWFMVQAASQRRDTLQRVSELTEHPDFTLSNPNRVRSLLAAAALNQARFHQADGAGYRLLADFVLRIDATNPQLAARLVANFNSYRRMEPVRQSLIHQQLSRIAAHADLSKDVYEIVERALRAGE